MVLVGVGMGFGLLPIDDEISLDPQDHRDLVTHVTEFTVLVSLMGVGLAIDRTLDPRSWTLVAHLVAGVAAAAGHHAAHHRSASRSLGWWVAGLAPAVALLLGAALAPTDPVLASDVQVGEPLTEDVDAA